MGLSLGANVIVAHAIGAADEKRIGQAVHTSFVVAIAGGLLFMVVSFFAARPLLGMMNVPPEVFDRSCLYMRVFSFCIPPMVFYNFGSAILRAVGDTRRPLYYLTAAGLVNVALNLLFVIRFDLDVAGVAWATVFSQTLSAVLVGRALSLENGAIRLVPSRLRIDRAPLRGLLRIGLPAGIQSGCFSLSNMIIQSAINSLGTLALAGNTAAHALEGFIYVVGYGFSQAVVSIVGQNYGGNHPKRIVKSIRQCMSCSTIAMIATGLPMLLGGRLLLRAFTTDPGAIECGMDRMRIILPTYFICAMMDLTSGAMRGIGKSLAPTVISLVFAIVFRILWVFLVFPLAPSMFCLIISYPISWSIATTANILVFRRDMRAIFGERLEPIAGRPVS